MSDERYNGWANWDTWETMLILENNSQSSYRWIWAWHQNFMKKVKRGTFDMTKAEMVVKKYLIPAARGFGMAKSFKYDGFVGDPEINPAKVDKREIVEHILRMGD